MSSRSKIDQDNAWKDMLDRHFPEFIEFFFPAIHIAIDWSRQPVFLDKELAKLGPRHAQGKRLADKLAKVWRRNGTSLCVALHSEIEGRAGTAFNARMYVYNYRIADRENCPVVSLGIVTGPAGRVVLGRYETELWGCRLRFEFPVVKLVDWRGHEKELLASGNPFALVVLAHLRVLATKGELGRKYAAKRELLLLLVEHGYSRTYAESLLRFLDWLITLPEELERKLDDEMAKLEEEKPMPYVTHWERRGRKEGRQEGRQEGLQEGQRLLVLELLKHKLGALGAELHSQVGALSAHQLKELATALLDFTQSADLETWLKRRKVS